MPSVNRQICEGGINNFDNIKAFISTKFLYIMFNNRFLSNEAVLLKEPKMKVLPPSSERGCATDKYKKYFKSIKTYTYIYLLIHIL